MLMNSELMLVLAHEHHRDLIAETDRRRLFTSARLTRAARKASKKRAVRGQPAGFFTARRA
ncbi:hypothetical protein [Paractinoplanes atraurantiacus]|uniref:Uncharacterized protein n=1 Tax=Paractinoplanes atraurantiacus TaxID=1036182 RepID=A0A285IPD1_9ACTN|nr:hypothetical protein [Actinoplanes atraurantiacus]SNY49865.1 hypothetical protein SAMN05421748_110154 [Actinoplanes atraurantiacus]